MKTHNKIPFMFKNLSKSITCIIFSSTLLIACNQSPNEESPKPQSSSNSVAEKPELPDISDGIKTPSEEGKQIDQNIMVASIAKEVIYSITSEKVARVLEQEKMPNDEVAELKKIDCFYEVDNSTLKNTISSLINDSLSQDELASSADFYNSDAGLIQVDTVNTIHKLFSDDLKMRTYQDTEMSSNEAIKTYDDTQIQAVQDFWQSEAGQKLQTITQDEAQLKVALEPFITEQEQKCKVSKD